MSRRLPTTTSLITALALIAAGCGRRDPSPTADGGGPSLESGRSGLKHASQREKLARPQFTPEIDESLRNEALHALDLGVQYLEGSQDEKGHWSNDSFPAMTGLAVSAILRSPAVQLAEGQPKAAKRGLAFILSCAQEDGGIYQHVEGIKGGGLPNYNTAICLAALLDANDPKYADIVEEARAFLIEKQHRGTDVFRGGMGYDASTDRAYADLANTFFALDPLRRARPAEPRQGSTELDWDAAVGFLERCQHLTTGNDAEWVDESPDERGGFVYNPVSTKVETKGDELPSYGSATFAGIAAYSDAGLKGDDERVKAAVEWCSRHWSLDENARLGQQSLYYYYLALSRALNAAGIEALTTSEGEVHWRAALVKKLVALQRLDAKSGVGYWQNDNNRWWENDPNLATSYALQALETALVG